MSNEKAEVLETTSVEDIKNEILSDFQLVCRSREVSLLGRKEVLTGKAKFGIFGDGKELAQIAMAKQFRNGDFRSGYYRDQTFMMAIGSLTVKEYFAALYAHTDVEKEPASGGRQMGGHYATRNLNEDGTWKNLMEQKNSSADISPTAGQMPRLLGLAQASKVYRNNSDLADWTNFTNGGNEVAFGTIGDASTSEGLFWETINAAGVLQVPMVMSVWDDGWGISVPKKYQTTKGNISDALAGFAKDEDSNGYKIFKVKGWDYPSLIKTYEDAVEYTRENHVPSLIHVEEVTQPQGHSTSGSHERYKTPEQLEWAKEYDCVNQFKKWIANHKFPDGSTIATLEELEETHKAIKKEVRAEQKAAWAEFTKDLKDDFNRVMPLMEQIADGSKNKVFIEKAVADFKATLDPIRKDMFSAAKKVLRLTRGEDFPAKTALQNLLAQLQEEMYDKYSSYLYSESAMSPVKIDEVAPSYDDEELVDGRIILRENFKHIFENRPEVLSFGEDTGKIGGVNQSMEGMQEQFGELRVSDTGIREATIVGQGIGMALRGLRPIAEIQYLDYLLYCLQIMSDDLATIQYRTKGGQKAPLIIRTRGHRLEGVWHAGSPMGGIINLVKGIHVCVPRNMTKAAGFYNTLLEGDDPALVIECLNGYRSKEKMPTNLGEFKTPLGIPEVVEEGEDVTIVSYGSTFNLCVQAAKELREVGISVELIDVQTLIPFDINHSIVESLKKTNRVLFVDEDVEGGATGYMMQQVLQKQGGYYYLDSAPKTLTSKDHRPAYGSDGDYFSKPNVEDIFDAVYEIMHEFSPEDFPY
ncbi:alpha-ketoacid dehydrogenase subunit alpha/beta [Parvicella tangerina]|uniref:3-methyl-2-oxobutanoate dehydrogenase (2-methylpropanoyl-transferring) n=1 Tax=Parvicella tangerina TaxID=2829795 RepID=A0A916NBG7_9FLAO|nr:alpha-ketoacid dehydrogenase subunit alpha/beta [Parvicella tangerina]CAG5080894.1 1-deoxy-D-xylulose-5-phosphate synthase [Parvicella tangerina]